MIHFDLCKFLRLNVFRNNLALCLTVVCFCHKHEINVAFRCYRTCSGLIQAHIIIIPYFYPKSRSYFFAPKICLGASIPDKDGTSLGTPNCGTGKEVANDSDFFELFDLKNVPVENRKIAQLYLNSVKKLSPKENERNSDFIEDIVRIILKIPEIR